MRPIPWRAAALAASLSGALALLASGSKVRAQVDPSPTPTASPGASFDHLECFPIRDGLRQQTYTADLIPQDGDVFTSASGDRIVGGKLERGCRIRVPARELCIPVSKQNAREIGTELAPPGTDAGADAGEFLCYSLSCPRDRVKEKLNITDQFGTRPITVLDRPSKLCAPVNRGTPTPTPSATPTATPSPTGTPAPTGTPTPTGTPLPTVTPTPTGTPAPTSTPTPTGTPAPTATPTPTAGSPSGAFLDAPVVY